MKKIILGAVILFGCLILPQGAGAQYYDWGQDPASVRWRKTKGEYNNFIYPDYFRGHAVRVMHYMDSVRKDINYGFRHGPMRMPVVFRTQNFQPNGLVMLAPKRMEYIITPPASTFAMPWLKQLSVHEYRHSVQYSNTNRGVVKVLSYILGQQGSLIGMALIPIWMVEGDAVLAETQMSTFGRGVQPSFTIDYRAMALEGVKPYPKDKLFSGSFKDNIPDHYHLGYQMTSFAEKKYGHNIWDKVAWFGSRNPYIILTVKRSLNKFYGTSVNKLYDETFADLYSFWRSLPVEEDTAGIIPTPTTSFTTYSGPMAMEDGRIIALKEDFDKHTRLVVIDPATGSEETIKYTGNVNTGISYGGGKVWWTEYREASFYEQRVRSKPCWYEFSTGRSGTVNSEGHIMFVCAMESGDASLVEYDPSGYYTVKYRDWKHVIPGNLSVHGFTYDPVSDRFYLITLDDYGMAIVSLENGGNGFSVVERAPSYTTLSDLKAFDGKLYFTSIASGKDEMHYIDLATNKEYRITQSKYGSFAPSLYDEGLVVGVTYTPNGYMVSMADTEGAGSREVAWAKVPENTMNPDRPKWDVMNLDELIVPDTTWRESKKYRKALHIFNFHSWAPFYFQPESLIDDAEFNVNLGVTLLSQNTLNSAFTTLGYKYTDRGHVLEGGFKYYGWAPKFEVEAEYGFFKDRSYLLDNYEGKLNNHFQLVARGYLPVRLNSGYHLRMLTPMVEFSHLNSKVVYQKSAGVYDYKNDIRRMVFSLQYSEQVRLAYRDFLPRWGYTLMSSFATNPFDDIYSKIYTVFGRVYTPGILPHHSVMVRGAWQYQDQNQLNFRQKVVFPRGAKYDFATKRYMAVSADYHFPVWYPDGGINSLLYFRRVRLNLNGDYARYKALDQYYSNGAIYRKAQWQNLWSYGLEVLVDIVPVRLPAGNMSTLGLSIHKPSNRNGVVFGAEISVPL